MADVFPDFAVYRPNEAEPVSGRTYDATIADYWNFLLSANPDNPVFGAPPALFTRGCYNYQDVESLEDIRRRSFCGISEETPSIIHALGSLNAPINPLANIPVFVTVLDTIALGPSADENANDLTQEDVLTEENDAVKRRDVKLTIQRQDGGANPKQTVNVFGNHRHRTLNPFNLNVPADSILADRMERPIKPGPYPNAIAEGFYVLIKFTNPGKYKLSSTGAGVRGFKSKMKYFIQIP